MRKYIRAQSRLYSDGKQPMSVKCRPSVYRRTASLATVCDKVLKDVQHHKLYRSFFPGRITIIPLYVGCADCEKGQGIRPENRILVVWKIHRYGRPGHIVT